MSDMISFVSWFFSNLPTFLMSQPINWITGLLLIGLVIKIFSNLKGV